MQDCSKLLDQIPVMHRKIYSFVLFTYSGAQKPTQHSVLGFQQWRFIVKYALASFVSEICMSNIKTHYVLISTVILLFNAAQCTVCLHGVFSLND